MDARRNAVLRMAVEAELARAGLVRTNEEITRILAERIALERDIERSRGQLNPLLGPDCFAERLRTPGGR